MNSISFQTWQEELQDTVHALSGLEIYPSWAEQYVLERLEMYINIRHSMADFLKGYMAETLGMVLNGEQYLIYTPIPNPDSEIRPDMRVIKIPQIHTQTFYPIEVVTESGSGLMKEFSNHVPIYRQQHFQMIPVDVGQSSSNYPPRSAFLLCYLDILPSLSEKKQLEDALPINHNGLSLRNHERL